MSKFTTLYSMFLSNKSSLSEIIQKTEIEHLDVIISGPTPPNPAVLLNSEKMSELIARLNKKYDYVIVDSPPVQPVSDTLILTQASDYNLFVIRSDETRTSSFMSSIKKIQNVGAQINGIVINDLDTSKDSYYSYYYSYSPEYYTKN